MNFEKWYNSVFQSCDAVADTFLDHLIERAKDIGVDWISISNDVVWSDYKKVIANKKNLIKGFKHSVAIYMSAERYKDTSVYYPLVTFKNKGGAGDTIIFNGLPLLWDCYKQGKALEDVKKYDKKELADKIKQASKQAEQEEIRKNANVQKEIAEYKSADRTFRSPYAHKKNINEIFVYVDIRRGKNRKGDHISIPLRNIKNQFVGVQRIYDCGRKEFTWGMTKKGSFAVIGRVSTSDTIYFCEGFATGASIYLATKDKNTSVVVTLDAYNMKDVVEAFISITPNHLKIIAADNDYKKENNVGLKLAQEVAKDLEVPCKFPVFERQQDASDWNDLHCLCSLSAVKQQLFK